MHPPLQALVIMGVAGCGKSSVSQALCQRSGAHGIEGDSFHPAANIRKMSAGIPLTDDDRAGWLDTLAEQLRQAVAAGKLPVLTCSALKRAYRDRLRRAVPGLGIVYLELTPEVAAERVAQRPGHFMPATLIDSQFAALEPPLDEPLTLRLDATLPVERLAQAAHAWWLEHAAA
ncbi:MULTISPECIES: gluconokinase, GntK/IdnK-type [Pseudomonas aeruginosa group]|uniref:Gluconokinase n=2 Tax=Pseudomonas paraeruginosa TaxID=2994495 RepID=A6V5G4_PSEP7|nr:MULTISPECIES: gluconokinase, GntK/IdnK-type [Pseudomonas aeruginosa group]ABR82582.1 gluconokinase [Pseudomonas aeruginosa PA7]AWE92369.1 carbohydrate kinase, thermoresistant glucokinase family protein [Pseudomonas paraeruginosa]KPD25885.1 gluconokinase [Pseudomonas paraeruginosa]KQB28238.1 gluconokinase [Pseudomonas paraeruginosa]KSC91507.1 gluconokinase [Pseudomonas aeruginosa]